MMITQKTRRSNKPEHCRLLDKPIPRNRDVRGNKTSKLRFHRKSIFLLKLGYLIFCETKNEIKKAKSGRWILEIEPKILSQIFKDLQRYTESALVDTLFLSDSLLFDDVALFTEDWCQLADVIIFSREITSWHGKSAHKKENISILNPWPQGTVGTLLPLH